MLRMSRPSTANQDLYLKISKMEEGPRDAKPPKKKSAPKDAKKDTVAKITKPKSKYVHPPVSKMVNSALVKLNEKNGLSVHAIKKYIITNYLVDIEKLTPFIKRYLSKAVDEKILIQAKGKGFSGSFKLAKSHVPKKPATKTRETSTGTTTPKSSTTSIKKTTKKSPVTKIKRAPTPMKSSRDGSRKPVNKKLSPVNVVVKVGRAGLKTC